MPLTLLSTLLRRYLPHPLRETPLYSIAEISHLVHSTRSLFGLMLTVQAATLSPPLLASESSERLRFEPYAFKTERHGTIAAQIAYLEVPQRHTQPLGRRMRLRVVRLPATGADKHTTPVVYLAGGPGGSAIATAQGARWPVFDRVRRETDVLLLDQRGAGLSEPPPACPYTYQFPDHQPMQRAATLAELQVTANRCIAHWQKLGVDLAAYTTTESAADIESLRRAMHLPRISLWGMSYGTHLALATIKSHGSGIERAVLMGVEGLDDTLKLPLAADAMLHELSKIAAEQGFADLTTSTKRVLASLREKPVHARSFMHGGRQIVIGEYDAQLVIATCLGRRSTQQLLPLLLRNAEHGDYALMADVVLLLREQLGQFSAMPLAMEAASAQSPQRRRLAEQQSQHSLLSDALNFPFPMLVDGLGLTDLGEQFRAPLYSDMPILLINGTLDGRTPPANALTLRTGLSASTQLLLENASHDDESWLGHADIAETIASFLAAKPSSDSVLTLATPRFATNTLQLLLQTLKIKTWQICCAILVVLATFILALTAVFKICRKTSAKYRMK